MKIKLNLYDPKLGKFIFAGKAFSISQIVEIHKIISKLDNLKNLKKFVELKAQETEAKKNGGENLGQLKKDIAAVKALADEEKLLQSVFLNEKISPSKLKYFNEMLDTSLTGKELKVAFAPTATANLSLAQINILANSFILGLDQNQVKVFANEKLDINQMQVLRDQLIKGVPLELVKEVADPKLSAGEMEAFINAEKESVQMLTPEAIVALMKAKKKDIYRNSLIDLNVTIESDEKGEMHFALDNQELSESDLEGLVSKGGEPETFLVQKKYLLDQHANPVTKVILSQAITAGLGVPVYDQIASAPNIQKAKDIFTTSFKDITGRTINFGRDLKESKRSSEKTYKIEIGGRE